MTKEIIIDRTLKAINILPIEKATEISDFADFLSQRFEENVMIDEIQRMSASGQSFDFLKEEPEIYQLSDLKENFNGKR